MGVEIMYKRGIFFLALVFLLSSVVNAAFEINIEPKSIMSNEIYSDETAVYTLTIRNTGSGVDRFQVYSLDPSWIVTTEPNSVVVSPGKSEKFDILVYPTAGVREAGKYSIGFQVKSNNDGSLKSVERQLVIRSNSDRQYSPAVSTDVRIGENGVVDPRVGIPVRIFFTNRNPLDLGTLEIVLEGKYISDSFSLELGPLGEVIRQFSYPLDPYTAPGKDTLAIRIYYNNEVISDKRIEYDIQANQLFFTREENASSKFLYSEYAVLLTNYGNIPSSEIFTYELSKTKNMFTKANLEGMFEKGELKFSVSLDPAESREILIVTNYRPFFFTTLVLFILFILFTTAYYLFRTPILVSKKAEVVAERDGGTSEIKIMINIRNRTPKVLENIKVVDVIPDITEIEKEFSIGTLKPSKIIRHSKKGTLIRWDFPSVEGYEERIITYRIHSKLGIVGSLELPSATVRFTTPRGLSRKSVSK